jgi:UTP-glucose-1-phosphate uridylyltransferase
VVDIDTSANLGKGIYLVRDLVEKPPRDEAPSDLAIIGRYVLTPDIFPALRATASDRTGEIQLTNGLRKLLQQRKIFACEIEDAPRHRHKLATCRRLFTARPICPSSSAPTSARKHRAPQHRSQR